MSNTLSLNSSFTQLLLYIVFFLSLAFARQSNWTRHFAIHEKKSLHIKEGKAVTLDCSLVTKSPIANSSLIWIKNGKPFNFYFNTRFQGFRNGTVIIKNVTIQDEGFYQCKLDNSNEAQEPSLPIHLIVKENLKISPPLTNTNLELGSNSKIYCKARSHYPFNISWVKTGESVLPTHVRVDNGTLLFNGVTKNDSGQYTCIAKDSISVVNSTINVNVIVFPVFKIFPQNQQVNEGTRVMFHCMADGDPKPTLKWDKDYRINGFDLNRFVHLSNGTLVIPMVSLKDSGKYGCIAGNSGGFKRVEADLLVFNSSQTSHHFINSTIETKEDNKITRPLAITVSLAVLYMILVIILIYWCRYRRTKRKSEVSSRVENRSEKSELKEKQNNQLLPLTASNRQVDGKFCKKDDLNLQVSSSKSLIKKFILVHDKLRYSRHYLKKMMLLGHGEFGDVYLAKTSQLKQIEANQAMMVKSLLSREESIFEHFKSEIEMFDKCKHDNIAKLLGVCCEVEPFLIILEYTDWGDLKQFLLTSSSQDGLIGAAALTIKQIISIIYQIANGMDHLSSLQLVHQDLACRNCLVNSQLKIKISRPKLSKDTYSNDYVNIDNQDMPLRWSSHEAIFKDNWSIKSDVWSFGILIWEILNKAQLPFPEKSDETVFRLLKANRLHNEISNIEPPFESLIQVCCHSEPKSRPNFSTICNLIQKLV